jgi:hypothetical protein
MVSRPGEGFDRKNRMAVDLVGREFNPASLEVPVAGLETNACGCNPRDAHRPVPWARESHGECIAHQHPLVARRWIEERKRGWAESVRVSPEYVDELSWRQLRTSDANSISAMRERANRVPRPLQPGQSAHHNLRTSARIFLKILPPKVAFEHSTRNRDHSSEAGAAVRCELAHRLT